MSAAAYQSKLDSLDSPKKVTKKSRFFVPLNTQIKELYPRHQDSRRRRSLQHSFRYKLTAWRLKHLRHSTSRVFIDPSQQKLVRRQNTIKIAPPKKVDESGEADKTVTRRRSCHCSECGSDTLKQRRSYQCGQCIQEHQRHLEKAQQAVARTFKKQNNFLQLPYMFPLEGNPQRNSVCVGELAELRLKTQSLTCLGDLSQQQRSKKHLNQFGVQAYIQKQVELVKVQKQRKSLLSRQLESIKKTQIHSSSTTNSPRMPLLSRRTTHEASIKLLYLKDLQGGRKSLHPRVATISHFVV